MKVNQGFAPPAGRKSDYDVRLDADVVGVRCGQCRKTVPAGTAHIVISPYGPDMHVMYCPECCACAAQ